MLPPACLDRRPACTRAASSEVLRTITAFVGALHESPARLSGRSRLVRPCHAQFISIRGDSSLLGIGRQARHHAPPRD